MNSDEETTADSNSNNQSLEHKLQSLLQALHNNGSDDWEGKPQQISLEELLRGDAAPPAELTVSAPAECGASARSAKKDETLEDLMNDYVSNVREIRRLEEPAGEAKTTIPCLDMTEKEGDMNFNDILCALDSLPDLALK